MAVAQPSPTTVQRLVTQVSLALAPLQASLSSADAAVALLSSLGWAPPPGFDIAKTLGVDATGFIAKLERVCGANATCGYSQGVLQILKCSRGDAEQNIVCLLGRA